MRKRTVGFVFQKFNLLPNLTARDNIAVARHIAGLDPQPGPKFEEILKSLGINGRLDHKPAALSGGEQQRVAIARALANDPPVLIADEPTGNLDSRTAGQVFDTLAALTQQGKTVIFVTHDPHLAARASARIELLDGQITDHHGANALVTLPQASMEVLQ